MADLTHQSHIDNRESTSQSTSFRVIELNDPVASAAFFRVAAASVDPAQVAQSAADCHLLAIAPETWAAGAIGAEAPEDMTPLARCSLWWERAPSYANERIGCIGHYAAVDSEAGMTLLQAACRRLAQAGCTLAVGPLDGSTFRAYRFVVQASGQSPTGKSTIGQSTEEQSTEETDGVHPPFFLEPQNPPQWPQEFRRLGFTELSHYVSARTNLDSGIIRNAQQRIAQVPETIQIRHLNQDAFDQELMRIYELVMQAFRSNLLFAPISRAEFAAQFAPLRHILQPELVLLAEKEGRLAGFLLGLPDLAQAQRGESVTTAIFKTLAVHPHMAGLGVGSLLAAHAHLAAQRLGYHHVIHALMQEDNRSRHISAHYAQPMRRYALFQRRLA